MRQRAIRMGTWEERMTPRPKIEPRLDLLEVCRRVIGPSEKPIECAIYQTDVGLEVRCRYGEHVEHLFRSQFAIEIDAAREIAQEWKRAVLEKGFEELSTQ
jgi:hypothetical protein